VAVEQAQALQVQLTQAAVVVVAQTDSAAQLVVQV
jgi:hypothetical protein